jgi:integrase
VVRTDATFADAAAEWLRSAEHDRACKPSTLRDYRSVLNARILPAFGEIKLEEITPGMVGEWRAGLSTGRARPLSNRTVNKALTIFGGIMERARRIYGLPSNPVRDIEKLRERWDPTRFNFYSREEVHALARAAGSEQDAAISLTAAFTGLRRGEIAALCWRDVDFDRSSIRVSASYGDGKLTSPKSGRGPCRSEGARGRRGPGEAWPTRPAHRR